MSTLKTIKKKAAPVNLNDYFLFRYITEMGDTVKYCDSEASCNIISFAKVHMSEYVVAIYAAHCYMDSDGEGKYMDEQATGELLALYDQKTRKIRLFKTEILSELFSKKEISELEETGILVPLSFDDVLSLATVSGHGDMPHVFTGKIIDSGADIFISDTVVDQIVNENVYTKIDEEMLLPAVIKELEKLKFCVFDCRRFSSRVYLAPSSSWEEEAARRWLMATLSPKFPCFSLYNGLRRYKGYIQRKITELERKYYDEGVVAVTFYDVFRCEKVFHARDEGFGHTAIKLFEGWRVACDLNLCCISPAEMRMLRDYTYMENGDENSLIVPWSDIISIKGKYGTRKDPSSIFLKSEDNTAK